MTKATNGQTEGENGGYNNPRMVVKKGKESPEHGWFNAEFMAIPSNEITATAKLVYFHLKFLAGQKQVCWRSVRNIGLSVGTKSIDTVQKCLESLEKSRFILILPKIGYKGVSVFIVTNKADMKGYAMHWPLLVTGLKAAGVKPLQVRQFYEMFYDHAVDKIHNDTANAAYEKAKAYFQPAFEAVPVSGTPEADSVPVSGTPENESSKGNE